MVRAALSGPLKAAKPPGSRSRLPDPVVIIPGMSLFMDGKDLYQFVRVIPDHQIGVDQFLVVIKEIGGAGESPCIPQVKKTAPPPRKGSK